MNIFTFIKSVFFFLLVSWYKCCKNLSKIQEMNIYILHHFKSIIYNVLTKILVISHSPVSIDCIDLYIAKYLVTNFF